MSKQDDQAMHYRRRHHQVRFIEQELELKTNTELTRAIHVMTTEPHRRLIEDGAEQ
ncbi:hypothetical protein [Streptomyces sp. NPDC058678]|uniref:hypothetical protein n=1 Tax=Streptomyces sp. NPDC058678 TaxID=3346595 RepID=UPI0036653148